MHDSRPTSCCDAQVTAAPGQSLPIDPEGYVRFDQQRTCAEL